MPRSIMPQWIAAAQLIIDLMRTTGLLFDDDVFAASSRDVLIFLAVMIGHAQRRPMTALNVSEYVGIPRATVTRRLDEMCERKIVLRLNDGKWALALDENNLRQTMARTFNANLSHINSTRASLSKMDK